MDGTADRTGVFIIAASNRPDILDPALLRPGRLDKSLYVQLPNPMGRARILEACARRSPLADDVDLSNIAFRPECKGFSGADMASLLREAAISSLKVGPYTGLMNFAILQINHVSLGSVFCWTARKHQQHHLTLQSELGFHRGWQCSLFELKPLGKKCTPASMRVAVLPAA
jgi:hypothetical protein